MSPSKNSEIYVVPPATTIYDALAQWRDVLHTKDSSMPKTKLQEQRRGERVSATHPVRVNNTIGFTRNISSTGVYFEVETPFALGEQIDFVIELGKRGINFLLKCKGEIVRLERHDDKSGIAVRIIESMMESA